MKLPDGVTYRQLHYWIRQGYLPPEATEGLSPGTGHPREWTPSQRRMLTVMGQLRLVGIEAAQAGEIAVKARDQAHGVLITKISPGITIMVDLDTLPA